MLGKIISCADDRDYRFHGVIRGEDGATYYFNGDSWQCKELTLEDVAVDMAVEFDLRPPNRKGVIYPWQIRRPGEESNPFATRHSQGEFKSFVYVQVDGIASSLSQIVGRVEPRDLFRQLANAFNNLEDGDFRFEADSVQFPSGFSDAAGVPILLYCVPNPEAGKSPWFCNRVTCGGRMIGGSVFDLINANWYDLEEELKQLLPEVTDSPRQIVDRIVERCIDQSTALVPLKDGQVCSLPEADELYAPTGYCIPEGQELYLQCTYHQGVRGQGWYWESFVYPDAPLEYYDKKRWLSLWGANLERSALEELANKTLEEHWSFGDRGDYGILRNYLVYTFARQWECGNVVCTADGRYAAFNTGLPDRNTYKYLYAFYERTEDCAGSHPLHRVPEFRFAEFVVQGRGGRGKTLTQNFRPLPGPPVYFEARSATVWELEFNDSNQVTLPDYDDTHILIHRCDRLPLDFYAFPARWSPRLTEILEADLEPAERYKQLREYFRPILENTPDREVTQVYQMLSNNLRTVIGNAVQKLSWNWRAVVPCYNPERNETCFLLPVSFCDLNQPDRAMIASAHKVDEEMIYTIHTVIPLEWAYLDARLVCRPESEWLAADAIR